MPIVNPFAPPKRAITNPFAPKEPESVPGMSFTPQPVEGLEPAVPQSPAVSPDMTGLNAPESIATSQPGTITIPKTFTKAPRPTPAIRAPYTKEEKRAQMATFDERQDLDKLAQEYAENAPAIEKIIMGGFPSKSLGGKLMYKVQNLRELLANQSDYFSPVTGRRINYTQQEVIKAAADKGLLTHSDPVIRTLAQTLPSVLGGDAQILQARHIGLPVMGLAHQIVDNDFDVTKIDVKDLGRLAAMQAVFSLTPVPQALKGDMGGIMKRLGANVGQAGYRALQIQAVNAATGREVTQEDFLDSFALMLGMRVPEMIRAVNAGFLETQLKKGRDGQPGMPAKDASWFANKVSQGSPISTGKHLFKNAKEFEGFGRWYRKTYGEAGIVGRAEFEAQKAAEKAQAEQQQGLKTKLLPADTEVEGLLKSTRERLKTKVKGPKAEAKMDALLAKRGFTLEQIQASKQPSKPIVVAPNGTSFTETTDAVTVKWTKKDDAWEVEVEGQPPFHVEQSHPLYGQIEQNAVSEAVKQVDQAAVEAATAPENDLPEPTEGQKKAGNYPKGHVTLAGLEITIENPAGSVRRGTDRTGKEWESELKADYGYIRGFEGPDGDHVDVFLNPDNPVSDKVFVVSQIDPESGDFDEYKVMMGYPSSAKARKAYLENYAKDWQGLGSIQSYTMDEFKDWMKSDLKPATRTTGVETEAEPEAPDQQAVAKEIADKIGAKFNGMQEVPGKPPEYVFTDNETGGTFQVADPVEAQAAIRRMRRNFKAEEKPAREVAPPPEPSGPKSERDQIAASVADEIVKDVSKKSDRPSKPEAFMKWGYEIADALLNKDVDTLRKHTMHGRGFNDATKRAVFKHIGIPVPRNMDAIGKALDEWAGFDPKERERLNAENKAASEQRKRDRKEKKKLAQKERRRESALNFKVNFEGRSMSQKALIDELLSAGYQPEYAKGEKTPFRMVTPDGNSYVPLRRKAAMEYAVEQYEKQDKPEIKQMKAVAERVQKATAAVREKYGEDTLDRLTEEAEDKGLDQEAFAKYLEDYKPKEKKGEVEKQEAKKGDVAGQAEGGGQEQAPRDTGRTGRNKGQERILRYDAKVEPVKGAEARYKGMQKEATKARKEWEDAQATAKDYADKNDLLRKTSGYSGMRRASKGDIKKTAPKAKVKRYNELLDKVGEAQKALQVMDKRRQDAEDNLSKSRLSVMVNDTTAPEYMRLAALSQLMAMDDDVKRMESLQLEAAKAIRSVVAEVYPDATNAELDTLSRNAVASAQQEARYGSILTAERLREQARLNPDLRLSNIRAAEIRKAISNAKELDEIDDDYMPVEWKRERDRLLSGEGEITSQAKDAFLKSIPSAIKEAKANEKQAEKEAAELAEQQERQRIEAEKEERAFYERDDLKSLKLSENRRESEPPAGAYDVKPISGRITSAKSIEKAIGVNTWQFDETRDVLRNLYVTNRKGVSVAVATDGRRLVVVPHEGEDGTFIDVKTGEVKTGIGTFPNFEQFIPVKSSLKKKVKITDELIDQLRGLVRANKFTPKKFKSTITAAFAEGSDIITLNPTMTLEVIESLIKAGHTPNEIRWTDDGSPILVTTDDANALGVQMPMRVGRLQDMAHMLLSGDKPKVKASMKDMPVDGQPYEMRYIRFKEKAVDMGSRFGQDVEPAGRYMNQINTRFDENLESDDRAERGTIRFESPLVIPFGDGYQEPSNWKNVLSNRFGGRTGKALSKAILKAGYDAVITVEDGHTSEIVDLTVIGKPAQLQIRSQEKPLVVVHNMSAKNLKFTDELGGLAMPSIAISAVEHPISGFGEISLVAPPSLIDPRTSRKNVIVDADGYTVRYPSVTYTVKSEQVDKILKPIKDWLHEAYPAIQDQTYGIRSWDYPYHAILEAMEFDRNGLDRLGENDGVKMYYLATQHGMKPVDTAEYNNDINEAITKHKADYEQWVVDTFTPLLGPLKMFKGFTYSGNRSYAPYTLDNIMRAMRKEIRESGGESFFYGAGSIRARVAKRYRSLSEVKKDRGRVVRSEEADKFKGEFNDRAFNIAVENSEAAWLSKPTFYADSFWTNIMEAYNRSPERRAAILAEYGIDDSLLNWDQINEFLDDLRNAPTEYFEAKPDRVVALDEFTGAVVPNNLGEETMRLLRKHGITDVEQYDGTPGDRARAINAISARQQIQFSAKQEQTLPMEHRKKVKLSKGVMLLNTDSDRFDLRTISNRRFMYHPQTKELVLGIEESIDKQMQSSHAEEWSESAAKGAYDDAVRGWIGTGKDYPEGVIHFAPDIRVGDSAEMWDKGWDTLEMFRRNGAIGDTVVRGFGEYREQSLRDAMGTTQASTKEGVKDEDYRTEDQVTQRDRRLSEAQDRWQRTLDDTKSIIAESFGADSEDAIAFSRIQVDPEFGASEEFATINDMGTMAGLNVVPVISPDIDGLIVDKNVFVERGGGIQALEHEMYHSLEDADIPAVRELKRLVDTASDEYRKYVSNLRQIRRGSITEMFNGASEVAADFFAGHVFRYGAFIPRAFRDVRRSTVLVTEIKDIIRNQAAESGLKYSASDPVPMWQSQLRAVIDEKMPNKALVSMVKAFLKPEKGLVKAEEVEWMGVIEWLDQQGKMVEKQALLDYLDSQRVEIVDVMKSTLTEHDKNELYARLREVDDQIEAIRMRYQDSSETLDEFEVQLEEDALYNDLNLEREDIQNTLLEMDHGGEQIDRGQTKFGQYVLPGGENYRELLMTMPRLGTPGDIRNENGLYVVYDSNGRAVAYHDTIEQAKKQVQQFASGKFTGGHWDEPNVLVHVRFNERKDADGKRVLFLEEVQSDWGQRIRSEGVRSGPSRAVFNEEESKTRAEMRANGKNAPGNVYDVYASNGDFLQTAVANSPEEAVRQSTSTKAQSVPPMPFPKSWPILAVKRMIRHAVDNNFDAIAFTTGEQQAERYDLSKQVDHIEYKLNDDGTVDYEVAGIDTFAPIMSKSGASKEDVAKTLGKDIAQKMFADDGIEDEVFGEGYKGLIGDDLKVGGEGMKSFYDSILPAAINKYVKKWGGKVVEGTIPTPMEGNEFGFDEYRVQRHPSGQGWAVYAYSDGEKITQSGGIFEKESQAVEHRNSLGGEAYQQVHVLKLTPSMRREVKAKPQPMFSMKDSEKARTRREIAEELVKLAKSRPASEQVKKVSKEVTQIQREAAAVQRGKSKEKYQAMIKSVRDHTKTIKARQEALIRYARENLPPEQREKLFTYVKNMTTDQDRKSPKTGNKVLDDKFEKAIAYVDELHAEVAKKNLARGIVRYSKLKKIDQDYKDQIDAILEKFDLKKRTGKTLEKREAVREFVERQREAGETILVPESVLDMIERKSLNEITVDELEELHDTISHLATLGVLKTKLIARKNQRDYQKAKDALVRSIQKHNYRHLGIEAGYLPPSQRRKGRPTSISDGAAAFFALADKVDFITYWLDGFQTAGEANTELFMPIKDAEDSESTMSHRFNDDTAQILTPIKKQLRDIVHKPVTIPGLPYTLTREEMMGVYVNSMNTFNLQRLLYGNEMTPEQIRAVVDAMPEADKRVADGMMRQINTFYGRMADVTRKLVGRRPRKENNYWPIYTDKELSDISRKREQEKDMFMKTYEKAYIERGFSKERVGGKEPVDLRIFHVYHNHARDVIHYITHMLAVRDVQKLISDKEVKDAILDAQGKNVYKQMMPWLQNVAQPNKAYFSNPAAQWFDRFVGQLRRNSTVVTLGLKLTVSLKQAGSFTQTINEIGLPAATKGLVQFYSNPLASAAFVYDKSPSMRYRRESWDRELRDYQQSKEAKKLFEGKRDIQNAFFGLIRAIDLATTLPSWMGAYSKRLRKTGGNMDEAMRYADEVARRTQPSASPKDVSAIMRGPQVQRIFVMFYTHFANAYNQIKTARKRGVYRRIKARERVGGAFGEGFGEGAKESVRAAGETAESIRDELISYWWLLIAAGLVGHAINNPEREKLLSPKEAIKSVVGYGAATIPLLGSVVNAIMGDFEYSPSPVLEIPEIGIRAIKSKKPETKAKHAVLFSGYLFGWPSRQGVISANGAYDLLTGETDDLRRLIYSKYQLKDGKKDEDAPEEKVRRTMTEEDLERLRRLVEP